MEDVSFLRAFAALVFVLALVAALGWGLRRFSSFNFSKGGETPHNDLEVVSFKPLDGRRRLAVIRWGDTDHLILLGQNTETAIGSRLHEKPGTTLPGMTAARTQATRVVS